MVAVEIAEGDAAVDVLRPRPGGREAVVASERADDVVAGARAGVGAAIAVEVDEGEISAGERTGEALERIEDDPLVRVCMRDAFDLLEPRERARDVDPRADADVGSVIAVDVGDGERVVVGQLDDVGERVERDVRDRIHPVERRRRAAEDGTAVDAAIGVAVSVDVGEERRAAANT